MQIKSVKDAEFVVELIRYGLIPVFNDKNEIVFWDDYFTYEVPVTQDNTWYGECEKQEVTIHYNWAFDFFDVFEECMDKEKELVATHWGPRYVVEFLYEDRQYVNPVIKQWDEHLLKIKLKPRKKIVKLRERKEIVERVQRRQNRAKV